MYWGWNSFRWSKDVLFLNNLLQLLLSTHHLLGDVVLPVGSGVMASWSCLGATSTITPLYHHVPVQWLHWQKLHPLVNSLILLQHLLLPSLMMIWLSSLCPFLLLFWHVAGPESTRVKIKTFTNHSWVIVEVSFTAWKNRREESRAASIAPLSVLNQHSRYAQWV